MRNWGQIESGIVITISIEHISPEGLKILKDHFERQIDEDSEHWSMRLVWADFHYGYILSTGILEEYIKDNQDAPLFLKEALDLSQDTNARYIVYDADADQVSNMELYEQ